MSSLRDLKEARRSLAQQQAVVAQLGSLVRDIERCETTILTLQRELEQVQEKHKDRQTTRDDVEYLTDLLNCAKKKLNWEKNIASLQKRTPGLLQELGRLLNDEKNPPSDEMRIAMLKALQGVQAAMSRLQGGGESAKSEVQGSGAEEPKESSSG